MKYITQRNFNALGCHPFEEGFFFHFTIFSPHHINSYYRMRFPNSHKTSFNLTAILEIIYWMRWHLSLKFVLIIVSAYSINWVRRSHLLFYNQNGKTILKFHQFDALNWHSVNSLTYFFFVSHTLPIVSVQSIMKPKGFNVSRAKKKSSSSYKKEGKHRVTGDGVERKKK